MFRQNAETLLRNLKERNINDIFVKRGSKPAQSQNIKNPEKRSEFIGVAKNASKWQTLVCTRKDKIFLGNYEKEEEAAKVVDFHSMLVKEDKAKVNQDYAVGQVLEMLIDYIN